MRRPLRPGSSGEAPSAPLLPAADGRPRGCRDLSGHRQEETWGVRAGPENDPENSESGLLKVRHTGGKESGGVKKKKDKCRKEAQAWGGAPLMGSRPKRGRLGTTGGSGRERENGPRDLRDHRKSQTRHTGREEVPELRGGRGARISGYRSRNRGYRGPGSGENLGRETSRGFFTSPRSLACAVW